MGYPKWKYHAEKPALIVHSEEEEKALGKGWAESPAAFKKEEKKADVELPELELAPQSEEKPKASLKKSKRR